MYLSFYGLTKKPFQLSTNSSFIWLGKMHREALTLLKYGILESQGFLLLTGDVGTGKTSLANALTNSLDDEIIVAKIPDPGMETLDFMNYISNALEMKEKFVSKEAFLIHFSKFLATVYATGKKVLLVIDECQRLNHDQLEEIRQLSNIEYLETKLLNIFFIGQDGFIDVLQKECNRALLQRIAINYRLEALDIDETREFIEHRLTIAGAQDQIFNPDVIRNIHHYSEGIPRRINIICDHVLLSGFIQKMRTITVDMVTSCVKDLSLPRSSISETLIPVQTDKLQSVPGKARRLLGASMLAAMVVLSVFYLDTLIPIRQFYSRAIDGGVRVLDIFYEPKGSVQSSSSTPGSGQFIEVSLTPNLPEDLGTTTDSHIKTQVQAHNQAQISAQTETLTIKEAAPFGVVPGREVSVAKEFMENERTEAAPVELEALAERIPVENQRGGFIPYDSVKGGQADDDRGGDDFSPNDSSKLPQAFSNEPDATAHEGAENLKRGVPEISGEVTGKVDVAQEKRTVSEEDKDSSTTFSDDTGAEKPLLPETDAQAYSKPQDLLSGGSQEESGQDTPEVKKEEEEKRGEELENIDPGAIIDWLITDRAK